MIQSEDHSEADEFLKEIDANDNDNITMEEISTFVREQELGLISNEKAAQSIFQSLDIDGDKVLRRNELRKFWASLGSVLSVEEVAEWAEHAQQLPSYIVAAFEGHRVTGYDFPELSENDGLLLDTEMGITRPSLRKRVLRNIKLMLLGADFKATAPSMFSAIPITCSRVKLQWQPEIRNELAKQFPVHKYIVQRALQSRLHSFPPPTTRTTTSPPRPQLQWQTIYDGLDNEYDDWVPAGYAASNSSYGVMYRITGWNALGRSDRIMINLNSTDDIPCPVLDQILSTSNSILALIRTPSFLSFVLLTICLFCIITTGVVLFVSAITVRIRKRYSSSSRYSVHSGHRGSSGVSSAGTIKTMRRIAFTDMSNFNNDSDLIHNRDTLTAMNNNDMIVDSVISSASLPPIPCSPTSTANKSDQQLIIIPNPNSIPTTIFHNTKDDMCLTSSSSTKQEKKHVQTENDDEDEEVDVQHSSHPSSLTHSSHRIPPLKKSVSFASTISDLSSSTTTTNISTTTINGNNNSSCLSLGQVGRASSLNTLAIIREQEEENFKTCSICQKPFKMWKWKWRVRHHCCHCASLFCSNCGDFDHLEILHCKIPGSCRCKRCITQITGK
eukprot:gene2780-5473_t